MRFLSSGFKGAVYGFSAWVVYGAVETILPLGTQLWKRSEVAVMPWQWPWVAILIGVYAAAGILFGAVAGVALSAASRESPGILQIAAVFTIGLALAAGEITEHPHGGIQYLALASACVLTGVFAGAILSKQFRSRVRFFTGPLTATVLLLSVPWLGSRYRSHWRLAVAWLVCVTITLFVSLLVHRVRRGRDVSVPGQLATAGLMLGVFCAGAIFGRTTPVLPASGIANQSEKPNVIVVTMDTVRADHMSLYGYVQDTTPNLRELAGKSTVYSNAVATSDFTLPTHGSIFTGLYPSWHGAVVDKSLGKIPFRPMDPEPKTLAEVLASRGYATAAVVANYGFLFPDYGIVRGFATVDWTRPVYLEPTGLGGVAVNIARQVSRFNLSEQLTRRTADIDRSVFDLLKEASVRHRPFFLFINYMEAHAPYSPSPPFSTRFRGWNLKSKGSDVDRRKVIDGKQILTPAEWAYVKSQYDGAVATEDDAIAVLVSQLRNLRLMENTLLIVTADHGEALGERGLIDHNLGTLYQNQVHVPLMVRYPGQTSPARSDALVSQIDIMPTVLDVAGIEAPPSLPGRSLRSNNFGEPRTVFAEAQDGQWKVSNPIALGVRRAAFQGSLKYILWSNGPPELYDLASNPDEQINSYKAGEPESERLGKTLASWISTFPKRKLPSKKPDEGSLQRLKSLGYVQ